MKMTKSEVAKCYHEWLSKGGNEAYVDLNGFNQIANGFFITHLLVECGMVDEALKKDCASLLNSEGCGLLNTSQLVQMLRKNGAKVSRNNDTATCILE